MKELFSRTRQLQSLLSRLSPEDARLVKTLEEHIRQARAQRNQLHKMYKALLKKVGAE